MGRSIRRSRSIRPYTSRTNGGLLVTGASSGIGKATVELLLAAGAKFYAAARRVDMMKDLESKGAVVVKISGDG